jgi:predicted O-methyltransferase YrrM
VVKTGSTVRRAVGVTRLVLTRPLEIVDRLESRRESRRFEATRQSYQFPINSNRTDALEAIHDLLGVDRCGACADETKSVAGQIASRLNAEHSHDGGETLARVLWALVRHLKPTTLVETGVARGISSAFILGALHKNDHGHLWSIDLPPLSRPKGITGSAIPDEFRGRWTYVEGSSRRTLPALLAELGSIDMFLHDGLHTEDTMTFEFNNVWTYLTAGGVVVSDDTDFNPAFMNFAKRVGREPLLIAEQQKSTIVGVIQV